MAEENAAKFYKAADFLTAASELDQLTTAKVCRRSKALKQLARRRKGYTQTSKNEDQLQSMNFTPQIDMSLLKEESKPMEVDACESLPMAGHKRKIDEDKPADRVFSSAVPTWCPGCGLGCKAPEAHKIMFSKIERTITHAVSKRNIFLLEELLAERQSKKDAGFMETEEEAKKHEKELNYALMMAVTYKSTHMARLVLEAGANLATLGSWYPIVKTAIDLNCTDMVRLLLDHGANIKTSTTFDSPASSAVRHGNLEMLKLIGGAGAALDDLTQSTPIHTAAEWNRTDCLQYLLDQGVDVNRKDSNGKTPGHLAVLRRNKEALEILKTQGADFNIPDGEGMPAWMEAVSRWGDEIIDLVVPDLGMTGSTGQTLLHLACAAGNLTGAKYLVSKVLDCNARDNAGRTPLMIACEFKGTLGNSLFQYEIIEYLLKHCPENINAVSDDGMTALAQAFNGIQDETCITPAREKIISLLASHGADPNVGQPGRSSLLSMCVRSRAAMEWLIKLGADPNATTSQGHTLLFAAVEAADNDIVEYLLHEVNVDLRLSSVVCTKYKAPHSPLSLAVQNADVEKIKLLVNSGCSLNIIPEKMNSKDWLSEDSLLKGVYVHDGLLLLDWLRSKVQKPASLLECSRASVLASLGSFNVENKVNNLPLPVMLKPYINPTSHVKIMQVECC